MLTYVATYRLRAADDSAAATGADPPTVTVRIADFSLHHAAARAEWRRPNVATAEGWHPGRTELVSVRLASEEREGAARSRARTTALQLVGCPEEAGRLVAAAAHVASRR
jgi:hypothetical protein